MHALLQRQLKSLGLAEGETPTLAAFQELLARVDRTYGQADQDRYTLERSLQISSAEMQALYEELRRTSQAEIHDKHLRLEQSLALASAVQGATRDGILVTDEKRRVVCANRRFVEMWRIPEELLRTGEDQQLLDAVLHLLTQPEAFRARVEELNEHPLEQAHEELQLKDGRTFERFSGPVLSEFGVYYGRIWTFRDSTERRRIELERLILAERMASMGRLAASVAHEINNPLAYVIAHVEELILDPEGPRDPEQLAEIAGGLERIRIIVRDLKTLSRAEDESRVELDPQEPLEISIQMASNSIRHRARLVRRFARTPRVLANAGRLGQVFLNLLVNAAEALPEGRAEDNTITVSTSHEPGGMVRVEISDTGVGIPEEQRARIFDPFFTTKAIGTGTGLGLSICKSIIESHGGAISVKSEVGVGTTFAIDLPASRKLEAQPSAASLHPAAPRRARVLVIDDEPLIGKTIERLLRREHDVSSLLDAREALRLFAEGERFDVILCDLMMPRLTGMAFQAEVADRYPEILPHLAFLTGGVFAPTAQAFLATTRHRCLDKPFTRATLLDTITAMLL